MYWSERQRQLQIQWYVCNHGRVDHFGKVLEDKRQRNNGNGNKTDPVLLVRTENFNPQFLFGYLSGIPSPNLRLALLGAPQFFLVHLVVFAQ